MSARRRKDRPIRRGRIFDSPAAIVRVLNEQAELEEMDVDLVRHIAVNYGFVTNAVRQKIWPRLLGFSTNYQQAPDEFQAGDSRDADQVFRDTERSLWRYTPGMTMPQRKQKQQELGRVINAVLKKNPSLHYYQGFNDVCGVFLMLSGEQAATPLCESLALRHIRAHLAPSFEEATKLLGLLFPLVKELDQKVYDFIIESEVQPYFALSWVLSWYAHDIDDLDTALRIYDFLLAGHPLLALYLAAVITVHRREGLFHIACDQSYVHKYYTNVPQDLPMDELIVEAYNLFVRFGPEELQTAAGFHFDPTSCFAQFPYPPVVQRRTIASTVSAASVPLATTIRKFLTTWTWEKVGFFALVTSIGVISALAFRNR